MYFNIIDVIGAISKKTRKGELLNDK